MIRLAVAGATGRMGRCILELASQDDRFEIAAALIRALPHQSPSERLPQRTALLGDWCGTSAGFGARIVAFPARMTS